jgi:hypothetical protein
LSGEASGLQPGKTGLTVAAEVALDEHGKAFAPDSLVMGATVASKGSSSAFAPDGLIVRPTVPRQGLLPTALPVLARVFFGESHKLLSNCTQSCAAFLTPPAARGGWYK